MEGLPVGWLSPPGRHILAVQPEPRRPPTHWEFAAPDDSRHAGHRRRAAFPPPPPLPPCPTSPAPGRCAAARISTSCSRRWVSWPGQRAPTESSGRRRPGARGESALGTHTTQEGVLGALDRGESQGASHLEVARRARDPLIQRTFAGCLALSPTAQPLSRAGSSRGEIITEILGGSGTLNLGTHFETRPYHVLLRESHLPSLSLSFAS